MVEVNRERPPSIEALVRISSLNPAQGDSGTIECPRCDGEFAWWRAGVGGKISGKCKDCLLTLPKG